MHRGLFETGWVVMQMALLATEEIVEALEPRPAAPRWQRAWHRSALRVTARRRAA